MDKELLLRFRAGPSQSHTSYDVGCNVTQCVIMYFFLLSSYLFRLFYYKPSNLKCIYCKYI